MSKKKVITLADVQFSAQRQMKSKKKAITPADCPLYEYHGICLRGRGAGPQTQRPPPGYAPVVLSQPLLSLLSSTKYNYM